MASIAACQPHLLLSTGGGGGQVICFRYIKPSLSLPFCQADARPKIFRAESSGGLRTDEQARCNEIMRWSDVAPSPLGQEMQ